MVASGSIGSGAAQQTAMSHGGVHGVPMPEWKVREGRGRDHALWEDSLKDLLPKLQLKWEQIYEEPPALPTGSALNVERHALWKGAVAQYQDEGTALFEAVRPSLVLIEPYALQDIKTIASFKRDGVKDGRALLRWALELELRPLAGAHRRHIRGSSNPPRCWLWRSRRPLAGTGCT